MVFYQNDDPLHNVRSMGAVKYWWHEMFRAHSRQEYKEFFTRGTGGNKDKENRVYPWMYSRVFVLCFIVFALTIFAMKATQYGISYPTVIFLGAVFMEVPFLVLIYELCPKCNLNILQIAIVMIVGATCSMMMVEFIGSVYYPDGDSTAEKFYSLLWTGFLEEFCKAVPAIVAILILKKRGDPVACFAIGAAVGAGLSMSENMGYIFANSFDGYVDVSQILLVTAVRGISTFGGHTVWAGFEGWAFGKFKRPLLNIRFYGICLLMMVLHCMWDLGIVEELILLGVGTLFASFIFAVLFTIFIIKKERRAVLGNPYAQIYNPAAYGAPSYFNAWGNNAHLFGQNYRRPAGWQAPSQPADDVFSEFSAPKKDSNSVAQEASLNSASVSASAENAFYEQDNKQNVAAAEADADVMEKIPTVADEISQSGGEQLNFASVFGEDVGSVFASGSSYNAESLLGENAFGTQNPAEFKTAGSDKNSETEEPAELSEAEKNRIKYAHRGNIFAVVTGLVFSVLCLVFCGAHIGISNEVKTFAATEVNGFVDYVQDGKVLYFVNSDRQFNTENKNYFSYKIENGKYVEVTQEDLLVYYVYDVIQSDNKIEVTFDETNLTDIFVIHNDAKVSYTEMEYSYMDDSFNTEDNTVSYFLLKDGITEVYYDDTNQEFVVVKDNEIFYGLGLLIVLGILGSATIIFGVAGYTANHIKARRIKKDEQSEQSE